MKVLSAIVDTTHRHAVAAAMVLASGCLGVHGCSSLGYSENRLHVASYHGDLGELSKALTGSPKAINKPLQISRGISKNSWTPLMYAAVKGHVAVISVLLLHGADPNKKIDDGRSPLSVALEHGHYDIARLLLVHGANADSWTVANGTALSSCVQRRDLSGAELLLEFGANPNLMAPNGRSSALAIALHEDQEQFVRLFAHSHPDDK